MRRFWGALLATLVLAVVGTSAVAQSEKEKAPVGVLYRLTYWEVSEKTLASLAGKTKVSAKELEGRRLQTAEVLGVSGEEATVFLVCKSPIVYFDPRATQFQIQYVNTGVILNAKCAAKSSQSFDLEVRQELSQIAKRRPAGSGDQAAVFPEVETFELESNLSDLKFGDIVVLGSTSGSLGTAHVKALDPAPKAPYLIATLELEAP